MVIRSALGNQSGAAAGVRQGSIRASANAARSDFMPLIVRGLTRLRKGTLGDRPDCPKARPFAPHGGCPLGAGLSPGFTPGLSAGLPRWANTPRSLAPKPAAPPPSLPSLPGEPSRAARPTFDPCHL